MPDPIDQLIERFGPDAVTGVLEPMLTPARIARIEHVLDSRLTSVVTVVEDTYDPHNAAATIRTTEALGLQQLHVVEQRFSATKGVTKGSQAWIDLVRWPDPTQAIHALRARGFRCLATLPSATASIDDVDVSGPLAIAFGNEHAGLSEELIAACDGSVTVPMYGFSESFNLSVTVALAMSQIAKRRRAHLGVRSDLTPEARTLLRARWVTSSVRAGVAIVERALSPRDCEP